jgi:actin-like ATPase involved in cell morphogenesis
MSNLDLEIGDEERANKLADEEAERATKSKPRGRPQGSTDKKPRTTRSSVTPSRDRIDSEIQSRLERVLTRIAQTLENRNDEELATIVREDTTAMSGGIVSLTHNVKPLRSPIIMALNLVEPLLAFGRLGGVLFRRLRERQEIRRAEWEAAQAAQVVDGEVING